jgi:hypothetical protein
MDSTAFDEMRLANILTIIFNTKGFKLLKGFHRCQHTTLIHKDLICTQKTENVFKK